MVFTTSSPSLNSECRCIPGADCKNNNKFTGAASREADWLGLHANCSEIRDLAEMSSLVNLETHSSYVLQQVTESQKCPLYLSTRCEKKQHRANSYHEGSKKMVWILINLNRCGFFFFPGEDSIKGFRESGRLVEEREAVSPCRIVLCCWLELQLLMDSC